MDLSIPPHCLQSLRVQTRYKQPQANGDAERAVGTVKRLLQMNEDPTWPT